MAGRGAPTIRPELLEIKSHIKNLKKEAEMRLALDVESQQSFEFLSDQVQGLRKAFSTLSDVLIEEVDVIRSEATERHNETQKQLAMQAKALKAAKTELALLRSEAQSGRSTVQAKATTLEERLESMQGDLALLAQEAAKGGSAQHLQQLELVQLRSQLEDEGRDRRGAQDVATSERRALQERLDAAGQDARSSLQALDSDLCTLRTNAERQLSAHAASIEQAKGRLLQCAQAIEKQWSASKVQQQRLESLGSSGALHNQQLQERVEVLNKQQTRWRASLEDAVKATAADVQLVQAQCRSLENAIGGARADARRLVSEQENETQDTLNLTSPLITPG